MIDKPEDWAEVLEAAGASSQGRYVLRLFVTGLTPRSRQAIRTVTEICEQHLRGRYDLEIVDVYQCPDVLRDEDIVVAPTLIKKLPPPLRKIVGDMANRDKVLVGLDIKPKP